MIKLVFLAFVLVLFAWFVVYYRPTVEWAWSR
jgi:hypothetical protein